jgi:AcrR family transcriptional regulator
MTSARGPGRPKLDPTVDNRQRILTTARELFSESGFERTTMRAIGRRAGVDPALIHHYFGTKSDLLVAALRPEVNVAAVFDGIADTDSSVGREFVHRVIDFWERDPQQRARAVALLRVAVTHEQIADRLREFIRGVAIAALGEFVATDDSDRRVAMVMSQMLGLILARYVMKVPGIADASATELSRWVGPTIDNYLSGDIGGVSPDR